MKRFVVMHQYGVEGWRIVFECDSILEAVTERENDLRNAGGESVIFEHHPVLDAYSSARYERDHQRSN